MTVEGICPDRYGPLRAAFEAAFANGLESGASLAVAEEGEVVVDLWGGARALRNPVVEATVSRQPEFRRAEMPASNGHGNARSVATVQALVSNGGEAGGFRLLREAGMERIFDVQSVGQDLILGVPNRLGIGFGLSGPEAPVSPNPRACYWGGWGGSIVVNDLDARTTFADGMNRMGDGLESDTRALLLLLAYHQSRNAG